ncbi:MAG: hypothetical protein LBG25_03795 [Spirochaetaceae bacterium]|jgi:hypothetical protein|nr:hypothetical protein [Spirochaetaceae bacterium]
MKRESLAVVVFFSILLGAGAQTAEVPVAVMPFIGDDAALTERVRDASIREVGNQEGFTPLPLPPDTPAVTDEPPDPSLLGEAPYVLTGESYLDDEDLTHFQLWLWKSETGALVFTDELMADDAEETEGYLPALVSWVLSKVSEEEEPAETAEGEEPEEPESPGAFKPGLYLGLRAGAALNFQMIQAFGSYESGVNQSFGGEAALTVEFQPWRYLGFQAEGIFVMESFAPYRTSGGVHTSDRYKGMSLLFPLFVKVPVDLGTTRLSFLTGPYYILPLKKTANGSSYRDSSDLPLGVMVGGDLGYPLGPGEFYGGLRYGLDLGLTDVEDTGLRYTQRRLVLFLGYAFRVF